MKVAFVHDWLTGMRGGEKVLLELCHLFPQADIYTLLHVRGKIDQEIERHTITTSFVQNFPGHRRYYRKLLPLFPTAIESFDLTPYDLVVSTSHCVAKGAISRPDALHVSYIHSPMRYIWDMHFSYFPRGQQSLLNRLFYRGFSNYLRVWDVAASNRVDRFIANSRFVAQRIGKYYRRKAKVIHPPVDVEKFEVAGETEDYYLAFSSLVPYKRLDLAIGAFNQLRLPLKIVGLGPEKERLKKMARSNIEFLDWLTDSELRQTLGRARALVFPGLEDFGIIPVEANACGVPVIAFGAGGVLDSMVPLAADGDVADQPTGLFFAEQSVEALIDAVERFEKNIKAFNNRTEIRQATFRFHPSIFRRKIGAFIAAAATRQGLSITPDDIRQNSNGETAASRRPGQEPLPIKR